MFCSSFWYVYCVFVSSLVCSEAFGPIVIFVEPPVVDTVLSLAVTLGQAYHLSHLLTPDRGTDSEAP